MRVAIALLAFLLPFQFGVICAEEIPRTGDNPAVIPIASNETRGRAAGWGEGRTWRDQHTDINNAVEDNEPIDLVLLGDSITQSWGGSKRSVWGSGVAAREEFFGLYRHANFGISGDRTEHLLWRIDHGNFEQIAPRVIVLMIGTNNLSVGHTPEQIAEGISAVIARLNDKTPRSQIVLVGVLPRGAAADDPFREKVCALNAQLDPLSENDRVTFKDISHLFLHDDGTARADLFGGDSLHLRPAGYAAWAEALAPVVDSLLDDLNPTVEPLPAATRLSLDDKIPRAHILVDPEWYTWGGSVIEGDDGDFHLFYSRWPKKYGFLAWLTHSEVAHAVASRVEGPYRYVETALECRGPNGWDEVTAHNPKIKKFDDCFYIYFCATRGAYSEEELIETARVGYGHANWKVLRNNQRTGVAVAESLNGPWKRSDRPIVEPAGPITTITVNPAVTRGPDGLYLMIVKGDKPREKRFIRNQALAVAEQPVGPFEVQPDPVIDTFDSEDCSIWYDGTGCRFYAVYHAHNHIGLLTSADGRTWRAARHHPIMTKQIGFDDQSVFKPDRLERPFVFTDREGRARMLFLAARTGSESVNLALPIRIDAERP